MRVKFDLKTQRMDFAFNLLGACRCIAEAQLPFNTCVHVGMSNGYV